MYFNGAVYGKYKDKRIRFDICDNIEEKVINFPEYLLPYIPVHTDFDILFRNVLPVQNFARQRVSLIRDSSDSTRYFDPSRGQSSIAFYKKFNKHFCIVCYCTMYQNIFATLTWKFFHATSNTLGLHIF